MCSGPPGAGFSPSTSASHTKHVDDVKNPAGKDARASDGFLGKRKGGGVHGQSTHTNCRLRATSQPMALPDAVGHAPWEQRLTARQGHLLGSWEPSTSPSDPLFICNTLTDETGPTELGVANGKNVRKASRKEPAIEKELDPRYLPYYLPFNLLLLGKTTTSYQQPREDIQVFPILHKLSPERSSRTEFGDSCPSGRWLPPSRLPPLIPAVTPTRKRRPGPEASGRMADTDAQLELGPWARAL